MSSTMSASACGGRPARCRPSSACSPKGRECRDVVTQLSAATKALEQAGFKIIAAGLTYCIENPEEAEADGYPLESVERMFMKLAR